MRFLNTTYLLLTVIIFPTAGIACDIVLSPGANIQNALNQYADVCLNPGVYNYSNELIVPSGKTLEGADSSQYNNIILRSSADIQVYMSSNTMLKSLSIEAAAGIIPTFGVLTYYENNVILWNLNIQGNDINIGADYASNVHIWDSYLSLNGILTNGSADPNIWISDVTNIDIQWGIVTGRNNSYGGDGDGEIAIYNSTNAIIHGTYVINSGASGVYIVNCSSCIVDSATIIGANGWGLDVVNGTTDFIAENNYISGSHLGGSVYTGSGYPMINSRGHYINNIFISNNTNGVASFCNGINYGGPASTFSVSGSSGNGLLLCKPW
jgi:hypothetical protein